jgi:hypothetical protein
MPYLSPEKRFSSGLKRFKRCLPFPALVASVYHIWIVGIHVAIHVDGFEQFEMVGRLERSLLHRVKLNTLDLDLENRGDLADRPVLLGHRALNTDFLDVEGSIDGVVNVPRTMRNVNLDIAPPFVLGPRTVLGGNVRASLSVEQANDGVSTGILT